MFKKQILVIAILSSMFIANAHANEPLCKIELLEKEPVVDAQHGPVAYIANFKNGKVLTGICDAHADKETRADWLQMFKITLSSLALVNVNYELTLTPQNEELNRE